MKTKSNIIIAGVIILVGLVSFISGRLSGGEKQVAKALEGGTQQAKVAEVAEVSTKQAAEEGSGVGEDETNSIAPAQGAFIASKAGKKYFPVDCGSAKTIKKENAMYFATMEEAELSGKTKSVQCKY